METLGIVEAARNAQGRLRLMGISIDEREMPREGDPPNREMDVARVSDKALRKREASWKQPLAEAATKTEPLRTLLRDINWEETRTHCGSRRMKDRNVPRWMTWKRVPAAAQAEKTKESKYGKTKGGVGVTGMAMQLSGRLGPGLDQRLTGYKRDTAATILSAVGQKALRSR